MVHLWIEVGPNVADFGLTDDTSTSITLSPNNYLGGQQAGLEFCKRTKDSKPQRMVALYGDATAQHSTERIQGFVSALAQMCPKNEIIYYDYADWSRGKAKTKALSYFLSDATITSVVCANDGMALGVIDAAQAARPAGTSGVLIVGYDNTHDIRPWLSSGTVPVTVDQLAGLENDGLIFIAKVAGKQLSEMSTPETPLTSTSVRAALGLASNKIESRVMPIVTNMAAYIAARLMQAYDKTTRPFSGLTTLPNTSGACATSPSPTHVQVQFYMTQLYKVDQVEGSYRLDGYFRMWWNDTRLACAQPPAPAPLPLLRPGCFLCVEGMIVRARLVHARGVVGIPLVASCPDVDGHEQPRRVGELGISVEHLKLDRVQLIGNQPRARHIEGGSVI